MAAAFARRRLEGTGVTVRTAGTLPGERPVDPFAVEALAAHGLSVPLEPSRHLTTADVARADLVLCLERRHLRDVVVRDREALRKSFTVRELVRRGERIGPRPSGTSVASWLAAAGEGRELATLTTDAPDDDVADPTGGPEAGYEHTARWLDALLGRLIGLLWPAGVAVPANPTDVADEVRGGGNGVEPQVEVWRTTGVVKGLPAAVGVVADRIGIRLARAIEATLADLGLELRSTAQDAWVAPDWAQCAAVASSAVAVGEVDVAIALTSSSTGAAMLANRRPGVRASNADTVTVARRARRTWGANVLFLGVEEVTLLEATDIVFTFLREVADVPPELDDRPSGRRPSSSRPRPAQ